MFRNMRFMLCVVTVYLCLAAIGSVCIDIFICFPVHYNWSLDYAEQGQSIWNSWPDFWINWTLNFSADVFRKFIFCHSDTTLRDSSRQIWCTCDLELILTYTSFLHPLLHYQIAQTPPETEVWPDWRLLSRPDHYGHQFRSLHDLHSLRLRLG
jgi:hypothetical protein